MMAESFELAQVPLSVLVRENIYYLNNSNSSLGVLGDSASISSSQVDVSAFAPSSSPRVLDDPLAVSSVADCEHSVVDGLGAVAESSRFVARPVRGVNAD